MADDFNIADSLPKLRNAVSQACQHYGVPNPALFHAAVMAGKDPRPMEPPLVALVRKIAHREFDEDGGDPFPTEDEWRDLEQEVLGSGLYTFAPVSLQESHKAAHKLMDFLHKNQKQITADIKDAEMEEPADLTDADIIRVRKILDDVF